MAPSPPPEYEEGEDLDFNNQTEVREGGNNSDGVTPEISAKTCQVGLRGVLERRGKEISQRENDEWKVNYCLKGFNC